MDNTNVPAVAAAKVLALVAAGLDPVDALRAVCGAATVDQMITNLYHELRIKAGR